MSISITNLNSYRRLFSSPVKNMSTPSANLIYGGTVSSLYLKKLSASLKSELSTYISSLNTNMYELKSAIQPLVEKSANSVFNSKKVSTENNSISASAKLEAKNGTHSISVTQLAQGQTNQSSELNSSRKSSFFIGENKFKVSANGKETTVSINVSFNDTNRDALSNLANTINNLNLGITAKVTYNNTHKTSSLEISSNNIGKESTFSIEDVEGDIIKKSGVSHISSNASNSILTIDGQQYTHNSNTISMDSNHLNVTFKSTTKVETRINVSDNIEAIARGIESFATKFNQSISFVRSPNQFVISSKLHSELKSIVSSKQGTLESVGIHLNDDASLTVDRKRLDEALSEDLEKIKKLFGGSNGIVAETKKLSERTLASTSLDSSGKTLYNNDFSSFYNYLKGTNKKQPEFSRVSGLFVDTFL